MTLVHTMDRINFELPFGVVVIENVILHGHFKFLNIFTNPPTAEKMIMSLRFLFSLLANSRPLGCRTLHSAVRISLVKINEILWCLTPADPNRTSYEDGPL